MNATTLNQIEERALELLKIWGNRSRYARKVIKGYQNWSGSDLQGRAKEFGAGYAEQRQIAKEAWRGAGGDIIPLAPSGRLVHAVQIDEHTYRTPEGVAVWEGNKRARLVK